MAVRTWVRIVMSVVICFVGSQLRAEDGNTFIEVPVIRTEWQNVMIGPYCYSILAPLWYESIAGSYGILDNHGDLALFGGYKDKAGNTEVWFTSFGFPAIKLTKDCMPIIPHGEKSIDELKARFINARPTVYLYKDVYNNSEVYNKAESAEAFKKLEDRMDNGVSREAAEREKRITDACASEERKSQSDKEALHDEIVAQETKRNALEERIKLLEGQLSTSGR